jgi:ribosome-associated heat shock protein Hsp15
VDQALAGHLVHEGHGLPNGPLQIAVVAAVDAGAYVAERPAEAGSHLTVLFPAVEALTVRFLRGVVTGHVVQSSLKWLQTPDYSMEALRIDVWLDVACLFRTRSEAQRACKGGKVDVNGQAAKPHREIRSGDQIVITRPLGRRQVVVVRQLADRHVARAEARMLYEDLTPPPTAEEVEMRRLTRLARAFARPPARPDSREKRRIRRLKEKG